MPQVALTNCPDCGYSLNGLPPQHRCPECAFEYDENTRVWKPAKPWKLYLGAGLSNLLFIGYFFDVPLKLARGSTLHFIEGMLLLEYLLFVGLTVVLVIRARRANARGRYVAITADGIRGRVATGDFLIPWNSIEMITCPPKGQIRLACYDNQIATASYRLCPADSFENILDGAHDAQNFFVESNAALNRWRAAQPATAATAGQLMEAR